MRCLIETISRTTRHTEGNTMKFNMKLTAQTRFIAICSQSECMRKLHGWSRTHF